MPFFSGKHELINFAIRLITIKQSLFCYFREYTTMTQRLLLTLIFSFFSFSIYAQDTPIGGWSVHFAYKNGKTISKAGDKIYVAGNGGMFSYDQRDGSMERISKVSGLSDVGISLLKYDKNSSSLLIAYSNANIDLLINNRVINMPELLKANVLGNKNINNVRFIGYVVNALALAGDEGRGKLR